MVSWREFADADAELSARVLELFTSYKHHTVATIRRDGSPRISGTEVVFEEGELILGMMTGTRRAEDLLRDPRLAIHSHSVDPPEEGQGSWSGEAKLSGRAVPRPAGASGPSDADWFRVELSAVVVTRLGDPADHLLIESWTPERGRVTQRR
ncbi:MAG TPA: pyridoxamine 5'-phosphate oxidase family protein [Acidimicrobiales bacterium]|nr:pyridoxamine 5'-phosphate oxidase family protein [Acidimicrobiales bacterium]